MPSSSGVRSSNISNSTEHPRRNPNAPIAYDLTNQDLLSLQKYFETTEEVDEEEFISLIRSLGGFESRDDEEILQLFQRIDANANGGVDWDELSTYLLVGSEGQLRMHEMEDDSYRLKFYRGNNKVPDMHKGRIDKVLVDFENDRYYSSSRDGTVKVWDSERLNFISTLHTSEKALTDCILVPKYNQLALCDLSRHVCFYDLNTGRLNRAFRGMIHRIDVQEELSPSGKRLHSNLYKASKKRSTENADPFASSGTVSLPTISNHRSNNDTGLIKNWISERRENLLAGRDSRKSKSHESAFPVTILEQLGNEGNTPMAMTLYHTNPKPKAPSDDFLILGCDNGKVKIYNITDRHPERNAIQPVFSQQVSNATISSMTVASDLNALILSSFDSVIQIYNLEKFEKISTLRGHRKPIYRIDFSNELNLIISCGREKDVFVWNPLIKKPLERLRGHKSSVIDVQFNTKDMELITLSDDKIMKIWDVRMYKCVQTMHNVGGSNLTVTAASFNPRRECVVCGGFEYGRSELISVPLRRSHLSFKAQYNGPSHPIVSVLYKPQFREIIIADEYSISTWDFATGKLIFKFPVHQGIASCRFDPRKRRVIVTFHQKGGAVYNYINGAKLQKFTGKKEVYSTIYIDFKKGNEDSEDENVIWGLSTNRFYIWDDNEETKETAPIVRIPQTSTCGCAIENYVVLGFEDGSVRQVNQRGATFKITRNYDFAPDSQLDDLVTRRAVREMKKRSYSWSRVTRKVNTNHFECVKRVPTKHPLVIGTMGNGRINIWNAITLEKVYEFLANPNKESICCAAVDKKGGLLITGDSDGYVCVFDISQIQSTVREASGAIYDIHVPKKNPVKLLMRFKAFSNIVSALVFADSEELIICGSANSLCGIFTLKGENVGYFGQTSPWDLNDPTTFSMGFQDKRIASLSTESDVYTGEEVVSHKVSRRMALNRFLIKKKEKKIDLEDIEQILTEKIQEKCTALEKPTPEFLYDDKSTNRIQQIQREKENQKQREQFQKIFNERNYASRGYSFLGIESGIGTHIRRVLGIDDRPKLT